MQNDHLKMIDVFYAENWRLGISINLAMKFVSKGAGSFCQTAWHLLMTDRANSCFNDMLSRKIN